MNDKLNFLLESQFWSYKKLKNYQWGKFQDLIKHAYDNVPYYNRIFKENNLHPKDIKNFEDIGKIPILTKDQIRNYFNTLISIKEKKEELYVNSTGGSTGIPIKILQDKNYLEWAEAARIRAWKYFPECTEETREALLWGAVRDIGGKFGIKKMLKTILLKKDLKINTFDLDEGLIKKFILMFNLVKPKLLRGYASSLYFVSKYILEKKIRMHHPRSIVSSAESLSENMRNTIHDVFKCRIFDSYGSREVSQIAMECRYSNGYHIVMENQYVELQEYQENFKKLIITNLNNYAMPLIRYEIGDLADKIEYSNCSCGRNSEKINKLFGRENENIILSNGKIINGEYFEFLFYNISNVEKYQVIYSVSKEKLYFKLISQNPEKRIATFLANKIKEHFNFVNVEVSFVEKLEYTKTGKFKFVWMCD